MAMDQSCAPLVCGGVGVTDEGGGGRARLPRRVAPERWAGSGRAPGGLESLGWLQLGTDPHLMSHVYSWVAGRC